MDDMTGAAWINGEFMAAGDAKISIFDSGFIGGAAVFDTLACWKGNLFKLPVHRARFERSAHAAMIPLRHCGADLEQTVIETTRRGGQQDAYVQMIATRGLRATPSARSSGEPTLIVYAIPYVWIQPQAKIASGISVIVPSIRQWPASVVDAKIKNFKKSRTRLTPGRRVASSPASADRDRTARL